MRQLASAGLRLLQGREDVAFDGQPQRPHALATPYWLLCEVPTGSASCCTAGAFHGPVALRASGLSGTNSGQVFRQSAEPSAHGGLSPGFAGWGRGAASPGCGSIRPRHSARRNEVGETARHGPENERAWFPVARICDTAATPASRSIASGRTPASGWDCLTRRSTAAYRRHPDRVKNRLSRLEHFSAHHRKRLEPTRTHLEPRS